MCRPPRFAPEPHACRPARSPWPADAYPAVPRSSHEESGPGSQAGVPRRTGAPRRSEPIWIAGSRTIEIGYVEFIGSGFGAPLASGSRTDRRRLPGSTSPPRLSIGRPVPTRGIPSGPRCAARSEPISISAILNRKITCADSVDPRSGAPDAYWSPTGGESPSAFRPGSPGRPAGLAARSIRLSPGAPRGANPYHSTQPVSTEKIMRSTSPLTSAHRPHPGPGTARGASGKGPFRDDGPGRGEADAPRSPAVAASSRPGHRLGVG
ncbi:hypothetical protein ElP_12230 [Tautonia plasticadhaerens]|uniref:Uncharacterized protein n=1 Tax=Tautonia plasticadhaerens TaxID=2527974 RepID=A0A518GXS3_9BACT|nr:hypothetical protein ElP_12230 [Tautonia plasticadhaerens]